MHLVHGAPSRDRVLAPLLFVGDLSAMEHMAVALAASYRLSSPCHASLWQWLGKKVVPWPLTRRAMAYYGAAIIARWRWWG